MKKSRLILTKNTIFAPILFFLCLSIVFMTTAVFYVNLYISSYFLPNSYIGTVNVSSLNYEEAVKKIEEYYQNKQYLTILVNEQKYTISKEEINLNINYDSSVKNALNSQKNKGFWNAIKTNLSSLKNYQNYNIFYYLDENYLNTFIDIVYNQSTVEPISPILYLENNVITIKDGKIGKTFNKQEVYENLVNNIKSGSLLPVQVKPITIDPRIGENKKQEIIATGQKLIGKSVILLNENTKIVIKDSELVSFLGFDKKYDLKKIENYIRENVVPVLNKNPQNATLEIENGKVVKFTPSQDGYIVIEKLLAEDIIRLISQLEFSEEKSLTTSIPLQKKQADIKTENTNSLGIKELIGRGKSSFKGSIPGRIHNIELASSKLHGILIAPEETLSFNSILGDVSKYSGYKQAYIIRNGKTILGDGGGVCQVSTTLFRAVLNAGLPVIERSHHSYRVGYYEQDSPPGLDATVFAPTTDFKFKNDTKHYILVQVLFDAKSKTLTFDLYGTKDGRVVELTKPVIKSSSPPPEDLYIDDPNLPIGEIKQIEHKAWGAKVVFDYTVTKPNEEPVKTTFVSNYRPWGAVFMKGTKQLN
ncbi:MAG: VanW family protein [Patescibacteria group bacterium]|nr:VanW family protein [Patescibacteria group bacterium]